MTVLEIAGKRVEVGDDFQKLTPEEQGKTVDEIAAHLGTSTLDGPHGKIPDEVARKAVGINDVVRSTAEGVPIVGRVLNKLNAATNAAIAPAVNNFLSPENQLRGKDFGERYDKSLAIQEGMSKKMEEEHPIIDTAAKLAGGTAAFAPLAASGVAGRALGFSGTLPQMVARGAVSGAGIGAADAALGGEDPVRAAGINAVAGAGLPLAGRAIGKVAQSVRGGVREGLPTTNVAGTEVPQLRSATTGDNAAGSAEQAALSGAQGPEIQQIAQKAFDARNAAVEEARVNFGSDLAPGQSTGPGPHPLTPTPHQAGDQVITNLAQQHNDQMQQEAGQRLLAAVQGDATRVGMNPGQVPAGAYDASAGLGTEVQRAAQAARARRTAEYQTLSEMPGEFQNGAFDRVGNSMRDRLNAGAPNDRVRVNETTPQTRNAIQLIEENFNPRPLNAAERGSNVIGPDGRPQARPMTPSDVESVRQQLVPMLRDANRAAMAPGGSAADARGMRRLIDAFDAHVRESVNNGLFTGDGAGYLRQLETARAAHSQYRGMFSARGQGDTVGPVMEKIIGKHPGQELTPDAIASAMYGSASAPGGGNTVQVAQRLRQIAGEDSNAWRQAKQGLLSHILDTPAGTEALHPRVQADRISNLLESTKSRTLSQVFFTAQEREGLREHADMLRRIAPDRGPLSATDRQIMRLSGADGHPPATSKEAVDMIFGADGTKASSEQLARRLRDTLSPESFTAVKQGMWEHLTTSPGNMLDWGPQKIHQRLEKFLTGGMATELYSPRELQMIRMISDEYRKMIPLANTTNPSGSGIFATKMLSLASHNLMRMLGLATHGPVGYFTGIAADKALSFAKNRRAVNAAKDLFEGPVAKAPVNRNYERAAAVISKAAMPLTGGQ